MNKIDSLILIVKMLRRCTDCKFPGDVYITNIMNKCSNVNCTPIYSRVCVLCKINRAYYGQKINDKPRVGYAAN